MRDVVRPVRVKRERDAGDDRRRATACQRERQQVHPTPRQYVRREEGDVVDQHRVANRPLQRGGEHGDPKQVLRVGERARIGEEHRRVPEPAQTNEQPIRVPGQDPRVEQRVAKTVRERLPEMADQRIRGDEGGRGKRECDRRSFARRRRVEALPRNGWVGRVSTKRVF